MYLYTLSEAALNNRMEIKPEIPVNFELKETALLHMCKSSSYGIICIYVAKFTDFCIRDRSHLKYHLLYILYFKNYNQCGDFIHFHLPPQGTKSCYQNNVSYN